MEMSFRGPTNIKGLPGLSPAVAKCFEERSGHVWSLHGSVRTVISVAAGQHIQTLPPKNWQDDSASRRYLFKVDPQLTFQPIDREHAQALTGSLYSITAKDHNPLCYVGSKRSHPCPRSASETSLKQHLQHLKPCTSPVTSIPVLRSSKASAGPPRGTALPGWMPAPSARWLCVCMGLCGKQVW